MSEKKKRPILAWLINDDPTVAEFESEDIREAVDGAVCKIFPDAMTASKATGSPDVIVVDISAVGSLMGGPQYAYGPICSIYERHPGASFIINSAVGTGYAEDVVDLVKGRCPEINIHVVTLSYKSKESFKSLLRSLFPEPKPTQIRR